MNKILTVLVLFFAIQFAQAQDYKFGKVSKAELQETANPQEPEANATVFYRKQHIHFDYVQNNGFVQKNEIHERIKIYNKDGFDQATKIVRLYNETSSKEENLTSIKAITFNIEDSKINQSKLKKDGIFEEETNKYWKTKKFTMPNVKEGSVIDYKYTIVSPFINIDEVDFQQDIPIKKLDFKITTPEYFNYKSLINPKATYYPKLDRSKKTGKISLISKATSVGEFGGTGTKFEKSNIDFIQNIITSTVNNVPALKDESFVDNLDNYRSKLIMELEYIKYPNEPMEKLSTSWEKVSKTIYDNPDFGSQLRKTGYYENDINAIINGVNDPFEKALLIYNFVKSKVKWNDFNSYYTNEGVRKAYKEGAGNVADINLMLVSMLNYAGLNANPVLVSTRDNGIPLFPTRRGFNYVVCAVEMGTNNILLDASDKFSPPNILPLKALNWQGRLIRKDGTSTWVDLMPQKPSKEILSLNVKINSDLSISGKVRNQYTDYQALKYRYKFEDKTEEEMIESLEEDKGEIIISNFNARNFDLVSKPIIQSYEYKYDSAIETIGDKLYFSPLLFLASEENPFKAETREYPIDLIYPIADKYIVNVMLPDGYIVDSLPQNVKIQFNEADGKFTYMVRQNGNMLQLTMSINLNKTLILPAEYEEFKKFYQMMLDKQTEKVVLAKAI